MKNKIVVMGLTLLLLMMLPLGVLAGENLISNGDFSQLDDSGLPVGWTYAAWNSEETVSTYWTETGEDGGTVVRLENFSENDARLEQQAAVKDFITECNRTLPLYQRMSAVEFSTEPLPRTGTGKLLRK